MYCDCECCVLVCQYTQFSLELLIRVLYSDQNLDFHSSINKKNKQLLVLNQALRVLFFINLYSSLNVSVSVGFASSQKNKLRFIFLICYTASFAASGTSVYLLPLTTSLLIQ